MDKTNAKPRDTKRTLDMPVGYGIRVAGFY
jgi:hypothetical protein